MNVTIAAENFARWNAALLTGDPAEAAVLYADNLTLLPTMQSKTITDREGAKKYFEFFGSFHPTVEVLEEVITLVGTESYMHCGVYRFIVDTQKGNREPLDARFSFVWKKRGTTWEILHHHSSRVLLVTEDGTLTSGRFGGS